jgi:hypothetical protein
MEIKIGQQTQHIELKLEGNLLETDEGLLGSFVTFLILSQIFLCAKTFFSKILVYIFVLKVFNFYENL